MTKFPFYSRQRRKYRKTVGPSTFPRALFDSVDYRDIFRLSRDSLIVFEVRWRDPAGPSAAGRLRSSRSAKGGSRFGGGARAVRYEILSEKVRVPVGDVAYVRSGYGLFEDNFHLQTERCEKASSASSSIAIIAVDYVLSKKLTHLDFELPVTAYVGDLFTVSQKLGVAQCFLKHAMSLSYEMKMEKNIQRMRRFLF
ncbi:hypothetical protein EVAR_33142_1 [Eumeta japonica]|uniref:Uncharacterized protein n=1 Tax=Eumeta variegata TaxID=151549 RepID=A0A4C1YAS8_EUMVA|nr:hypothetical protein EVAR_33142_1 [Eumeta japonica]